MPSFTKALGVCIQVLTFVQEEVYSPLPPVYRDSRSQCSICAMYLSRLSFFWNRTNGFSRNHKKKKKMSDIVLSPHRPTNSKCVVWVGNRARTGVWQHLPLKLLPHWRVLYNIITKKFMGQVVYKHRPQKLHSLSDLQCGYQIHRPNALHHSGDLDTR